eukprot:2625425-Prymnesium_polylepis.1
MRSPRGRRQIARIIACPAERVAFRTLTRGRGGAAGGKRGRGEGGGGSTVPGRETMATVEPDSDRCTCLRTCLRNGGILLKSSTIRLAPSSAGGSRGKHIAGSEPPPALRQARTGAPVTPIVPACDDGFRRSRAACPQGCRESALSMKSDVWAAGSLCTFGL